MPSTGIASVDDTDVSAEERFQRLIDLPPSAKLVYKTLEYEGPMTKSALADASLLPDRTIRYAVNDLIDAGLITEEAYLPDVRQRVYRRTLVTGKDEE